MSAAVETAPVDAEAERAKVQAQRAETLAAQDEFVAVSTAKFDELVAELRTIVLGERPGASIDQHFRKLSEESAKLHNLVQHRLNLPHRFAREDAGEVKHERAALRETGPAHMVSWKMLATPLLKAFGPDSEFGPDDPRLLSHDLLIELKIGEDLSPDEQRAEAFRRLVRHRGSYVDTDLMLAVSLADEAGNVETMVLAGQRIPAIPMPEDAEAQQLHLRLFVHERQALEEFRGYGPVPSKEEQEQARRVAWRRLIDEERRMVPQGMSAHQREQQVIHLAPEWARWAGVSVP